MNFYAIHIQHFMSDSNSKNNNWYGLENSQMDRYDGIYMSGGKFIKPWQVTDKIIEWIFMQFTFNILGMTLTQKLITGRVSKIHKWIWGDMYKRKKVSLTITSDR